MARVYAPAGTACKDGPGISDGWRKAVVTASVLKVGLPLVLKTRRYGYDGKGQAWVRSRRDEQAAWEAEWERQVFAWACGQVRREVTDSTWQAFWRTAFDGQPGKRVAADLGLTLTAVYRARSRVLARLKELVRTAQEP